ncbi:MAG: glycosyltransferase, partial [Myxococcota bacterium]
CYNEANRLRVDAFDEQLAADSEIDFIFVDDGSQDQTLQVLQRLADRHPQRIQVLPQASNRGKAEAVRVGLLAAFEQGTGFVGYLDADLATPLREVERLRAVMEQHDHVEMVFGSRVKLLGRQISRSSARHYLGRVFATAAAWSLGLAIYDTQCGAKLFRASETNRSLFEQPFITDWTFDVEVIARRLVAGRQAALPAVESAIYELPLNEWSAVSGSKVRAVDFLPALLGLWRIRRHYLRPTANR